MLRRWLSVLLALLALAATGACAVTPPGGRVQPVAARGPVGPAAELRLGYFPNITHATAVYGVGSGVFQQALGATRLTPQVFNAGPAAVEALFAGSLDAGFVGPNPAVNAFVKGRGAVRIVSGATSGGAALVVRQGITRPEQLRGRKIATPQIGGTQDVALRSWLQEHGFEVDVRGGGDVTIVAQENGQMLAGFSAGQVDGAWVPEPWVSRLVLEAGATVLVDERDLWPGGRFVTTHLVVRTQYLQEHPQTVEALLRGQVEAGRRLRADGQAGAQARAVVDRQLGELTGQPLAPAVLQRAFSSIELTEDPLAETLRESAEDAFATGLVQRADLTGIYDLTLLRRVLGRDVPDAGLGSGRP